MVYRTKHPKPQFMRNNWENLNGKWQFEIDHSKSGEDRGLQNVGVALNSEINVPFCPESELSGVCYKDFMEQIWYKRIINVSKINPEVERVILHFGAVDYKTTVYLNGEIVGIHIGGYASFEIDITEFLNEGENEICLKVNDDSRTLKARGKQSDKFESYKCLYTRTTGIWQTVWLEYKPKNHIRNFKFITNQDLKTVTFSAQFIGSEDFTINIGFNGKSVFEKTYHSCGNIFTTSFEMPEVHLWDIGSPNLYDVVLKYGDDLVNTYFGMRYVEMSGMKFLLNKRSVFQRLVLDQGYYPDGIYTAPSDEALKKDIELALAAGFNGARLHQKVFEERFLYHCDKMGYMVWGEYGDWGASRREITNQIAEWSSILERDYNHPSIIGWCPNNEAISGKWSHEEGIENTNNYATLYKLTKAIDPTRLCIDVSGFLHSRFTDVYDLHDYEQDPVALAEKYDKVIDDKTLLEETTYVSRMITASGMKICKLYQHYYGEPIAMSEYGGTSFGDGGWGYNENQLSREKVTKTIKDLTKVLLDNKNIHSFCYTQLYDVEQEINGIYYYNREPKFDIEEISKVVSQKAAIED